ncbi:MAG: CDP-2,3-bis-(O-geranylgeranyl)-sn-glycerol synthase [Candidatus Hadarchaeota archaeon]
MGWKVELLELLGVAIWFILPAYVANGAPVVLGGGRPIDGKRKFSDGRPIFGPGKTVRGFMAGLVAGSVLGLLQALPSGSHSRAAAGLMLSLGALTGDLFGSFLKRRLDIPRGGAAPLLDQLGFVVFAMAFSSIVEFPGWTVTAAILIMTPIIHLGTNYCAYRLGLKDRPY